LAVKVATPSRGGLWRVGRSPDPICFGDPLPAELLDDARLGNRFDSPTQSYRVSYFSSSIAGCYGETLARFRPDPELAALAREDGFMGVGEVPADWRVRRLAVRATVAGAGGEKARFLDVESASTRAVLRREIGDLLAYYGYEDLDVATVRGGDRRITRWIGKWAFDQRDPDGRPAYAGVRYLSRLNTDWECWAVFDHAEIDELERKPILRSDRDLAKVARLYDLTVF
jgi:hypothetical protein